MSSKYSSRYVYEAAGPDGRTVTRVVKAETEAGARAQAKDNGEVVLSIRKQKNLSGRHVNIPGLHSRVRVKDLAVASRKLETMLSAGLPLTRALEVLVEQTDRPKLADAFQAVNDQVQSGEPLAASLGAHPSVFPNLMVSMVHAGETGGFVPEALARVADMYEKEADVRSKITGALTYPAVVLAFALLLVGGLLIFIVPIFQDMFLQAGGTLPLPTRMLVELSDNIYWIAPAAALAIFAVWRTYKHRRASSQEFRRRTEKFKIGAPIFGDLVQKVALARWARNFATLSEVGVPLTQTLDIVGDASGNELVAEAMRQVRQNVLVGGQVSEALAANDLFPPMVTQMVATGEETGNIPVMLTKLADYYDKEVEDRTRSLTSLIEPVMVMLLGGIVGTMVVCLYLPMFSIYQTVSPQRM